MESESINRSQRIQKKEAEFLAAEYVIDNKVPELNYDLSVREIFDQYIILKEPILSPSTIRGYVSIKENYFSDILDVPFDKLNDTIVQIQINKLVKNGLSPKTVKNIYGFFSAAMAEYNKRSSFCISLPKPQKTQLYVPTQDDISKIISYDEDSELQTAIILAACLGLRRSEICALTWSDIDFKNKTIRINKALVLNQSKELVTKGTKSFSGTRTIPAADLVLDHLKKYKKKSGKVITLYTPNQISNGFTKLLNRLEIPHFRFHDLRHPYVKPTTKNISTFLKFPYHGLSTSLLLNRFSQLLKHLPVQHQIRVTVHYSKEADISITEIIPILNHSHN